MLGHRGHRLLKALGDAARRRTLGRPVARLPGALLPVGLLGCPALRFAEGKVWVDEAQCVGCGLCMQTCGFKAIEEGKA